MTSVPLALELSGIAKSFGAVRALDGARIAIRSGEVHALLGENGAGKSTLVAIAAGILRPDAGELRRNGAPSSFSDPRAARRAGVALVPQHDLLVEAASVADNLALLDAFAPMFESARARRVRFDRLSLSSGLDLGSPDARVEGLPVGTRQRIGIAGALQTDPDVLILDEPTAVLSPDETAALFRALRRRTDAGHAILLITHRLAEVFEGADRLTLLSRGKTLLETPVAATTTGEVAALLLGGAEATSRPVALSPSVQRDGAFLALSLEGFAPSDSGAPPVSLTIAPGEALTLLAIDGNGADLLGAAVAGVRPARGRLQVAGRSVSPGNPLAFRAAGGAFIPADRRSEGLVVAIHPTRGLDIASSEDVRARLLDAARSGAAVFVVTADPEEARELGAPIRVVYRGALSAPLPATTSLAQLGRYMAGLAA